jgi:hypothetical protein
LFLQKTVITVSIYLAKRLMICMTVDLHHIIFTDEDQALWIEIFADHRLVWYFPQKQHLINWLSGSVPLKTVPFLE